MPVIELKNISKEYLLGENIVTALRGVDLSLNELGKLVVIMGPSGSGKSTLLNLLGGIDSPSEGDILIAGTKINKFDNDQLADFRSSKVGFVFQNFNLIPTFTALENVLLAHQVSSLEFSHDHEDRAMTLLENVGLAEHMQKRANQLSGGQMQRVAIARALMNDPEIILADEPTANLDRETGTTIIELLKMMATKMNKLIIIATHDELVESFGDRKISVSSGKIVGDES